jgi:hypothetical protein
MAVYLKGINMTYFELDRFWFGWLCGVAGCIAAQFLYFGKGKR